MSLLLDTDTASDDAVALLLAALSERADLEAVTVVAGNTDLDSSVRNALSTLAVAGYDAPVHPGAPAPLVKPHEDAEEVHGAGGFGGFDPDPDGDPADEHAVDRLVRAAREGSPTLVCLGPLTNVALALRREPRLPEMVESVVVMGGACNTLGNVTPAAEFNFYVDPEAARAVLRAFEVTLVDWGVSVRDGVLTPGDLDAIAGADSEYATFFERVSATARAFTSEEQGIDGLVQADALAVAAALFPELVRTERRHVDVDARAGMTRGYSLCDEHGVLDRPARTDVVTAVDGERFRALIRATLGDGDPDAALD